MNLPFVSFGACNFSLFNDVCTCWLSSYNALGLLLLLFCYLTLNLGQVPMLVIARDCSLYWHATLGKRKILILSYVVKVCRCSVSRAVNPVSSNSWLGEKLTLRLSFPWSKMNKGFLNKIQTFQSSLHIYMTLKKYTTSIDDWELQRTESKNAFGFFSPKGLWTL